MVNLNKLNVSSTPNLEILPLTLGDMKKLGEIIFDSDKLAVFPNFELISSENFEDNDDITFDFTMQNIKKTIYLKEYLKELSIRDTKYWERGFFLLFFTFFLLKFIKFNQSNLLFLEEKQSERFFFKNIPLSVSNSQKYKI